MHNNHIKPIVSALLAGSCACLSIATQAGHLYTGTIDGATVSKYVSPLVVPPVMPGSGQVTAWLPKNNGKLKEKEIDYYEIAVRQFQQQILPSVDGFNPTTVWSYGANTDKDPDGSARTVAEGGSFFYPSFTLEAKQNKPLRVRWINDLVDANGNYLPHLLPVDQTLHWANPGQDCRPDLLELGPGPLRTDCRGQSGEPYSGPVPMVAHLHGAHVGPESDGYPEAWWLPKASNIPESFATNGILFGDITRNPVSGQPSTGYAGAAAPVNDGAQGFADYQYPNDQSASTLWFHDHTLGMTRTNVYAGPAGFYLLRDRTEGALGLPGPAPKRTTLEDSRKLRELPIVIQDRSFNPDGSLYYPESRARFDGYDGAVMPESDDGVNLASDIAPLWNPEAFFETIVVNGQSWPYLDVAPARYRLRLLNGCNSRFLNLNLMAYDADNNPLGEVPFYQIGGDGGLLPQVVEISTGYKTLLPGDGTLPADKSAASAADEALLMGPAERMDVIVDFSRVPPGTAYVQVGNTAPDAPFGGFPIDPTEMADPQSTGQIMRFNLSLVSDDPDTSTPVESLAMPGIAPITPNVTRALSLHEEESSLVTTVEDGTVVPVAPMAATLGAFDETSGQFQPLLWSDPIWINPSLGNTELWEINNFTEDAHPVHLHLVQFQVVSRESLEGADIDRDGDNVSDCAAPCVEPNERGWKDTVIAYPGEVTKVVARFDLKGLYVWHCHILEHEDNEMMLPFCVGEAGVACPQELFEATATPPISEATPPQPM
ncbi:MAG: multicopper oxidase [Candidatus Thiodiazotropha sp.]